MNPSDVPRPPTLALFAVASAVFAIGALNYECRKAHREAAGGVPMTGLLSKGPEPSARSAFGPEMPADTLPNADPTRARDSAPWSAMAELPEATRSHALHSLSRACLLAHNALDLPPSLDYLYAHILNWTFLLHPSSSLSSTNTTGEGTIHGVASGTVCQIDPAIWKELGCCVNVARAMGLGIVDEAAAGGPVQVGQENPGDEEMSLWETEMRRRLWWMLVLFDQCVHRVEIPQSSKFLTFYYCSKENIGVYGSLAINRSQLVQLQATLRPRRFPLRSNFYFVATGGA